MRSMSPFSRDVAPVRQPGREMEAGEPPLPAARKAGPVRLLAGSAGALCLLLVSMAQPAGAEEFQSSPLRSMMDLFGLSDDEPKPEIEYRERAPLVVPPGNLEQLPTPQESAHKSNPAWPKDPDVARRKREAEDRNKPIIRDDPGRPLLPSELEKNRPRSNLLGGLFSGSGPAASDPEKPHLSPSQLGFTGWFSPNKQEPVTFTGEPERENLTQPPSGYLTPSPNAPYGVVEDKEKEKAKNSFSLPSLFGNNKQ